MKTKLSKVGLEIEGEFSSSFQSLIRCESLGIIKTDGSVRTNSSKDPREYNSSPLLISKHSKIKKLFDEFDKAYKAKHWNYNDSCGFHMHFSFKPKMPVELFSDEFVEYFLKHLKATFPDVVEKRGNNRFCQINGRGEIGRRCSERYRAINFWPAFERHSTIEFRIFPADTPEKMYKYYRFTLETIKRFIAKPFKISIESTFVLDTKVEKNYSQNINISKYVQTYSGN